MRILSVEGFVIGYVILDTKGQTQNQTDTGGQRKFTKQASGSSEPYKLGGLMDVTKTSFLKDCIFKHRKRAYLERNLNGSENS